MKLLFTLLTLLSVLAHAEYEYSDSPEIEERKLYVSLEKLDREIFVHQVFDVEFKTLAIDEHFEDIVYHFKQLKNVKLLSKKPLRKKVGKYFYDSFSFVALKPDIAIRDISVQVRYSEFFSSKSLKIDDIELHAIPLRRSKNFSNIVAKTLILDNYKTTHYSPSSNITIFSAIGQNTDLSHFYIHGYEKQGIESLKNDINLSKVTYYIILDKTVDNFQFYYFNTKSKSYETILIPIIVEDDSVSTQSDIAPKENRHQIIKNIIAIVAISISLFLFIFRRRAIYLLIIIGASSYIVINIVPIESVCVEAKSPIHILPMQNSTIFETTQQKIYTPLLLEKNGFYKIKFEQKTGWIEHENICAH